jgi:hypothetical protein
MRHGAAYALTYTGLAAATTKAVDAVTAELPGENNEVGKWAKAQNLMRQRLVLAMVGALLMMVSDFMAVPFP